MFQNILTIIILGLISPLSYSQVAANSFFGETKSSNPGLINSRDFGYFSLLGKLDKIVKDQPSFVDADVQGTGSGSSQTTTNVNTLSIFRGGKKGGFTTEFLFDKIDGTKKEVITQTSATELETKASVTHLSYGMGFSAIGIAATIATYKYSNIYTLNIGSSSYSGNFNAKMDIKGLKLGWSNNIGPIYLGLSGNAMSNQMSTQGTKASENVNQSTMMFILGLGIGFKTPALHIEVGVERPPAAPQRDPNVIDAPKSDPQKISGVLEFKVYGIILGVTSTLYAGGFADADKTVQNQLVYAAGEDRLENVFNFAFGAGGGLSVGGSYFISSSTTKEKVPIIGEQSVSTKIKSSGGSVKISYVW